MDAPLDLVSADPYKPIEISSSDTDFRVIPVESKPPVVSAPLVDDYWGITGVDITGAVCRVLRPKLFLLIPNAVCEVRASMFTILVED
jgi:hypothetical protein